MKILGIESSCDECSVAVIESEPRIRVLGEATYTQIALHRPFGGVVPEVASRNHLETINPLLDECLTQAKLTPRSLDAVAVANRPGLIGSLLVGVTAAKAFCYVHKLPLLAVNHLDGHRASLGLGPKDLEFPALVLIVSGGHSRILAASGPDQSTVLGQSRDDAAGEAFDKTAKLLGLGYPGGVELDRRARLGTADRTLLPRPLPGKGTMDLSFSGIKTAVANLVRKLSPEELEARRNDLCASIEYAIVSHLMEKIINARRETGYTRIGVVGGVAANTLLRERLLGEFGDGLIAPPLKYCTDNGAMIAAAGIAEFKAGRLLSKDALMALGAYPT